MFHFLFQEGLQTRKRVLEKNKENGSFRKRSDLQTWFYLFFVPNFPKGVARLAGRCETFQSGGKFEAFAVYCLNLLSITNDETNSIEFPMMI
jgi:hypothetical protein